MVRITRRLGSKRLNKGLQVINLMLGLSRMVATVTDEPNVLQLNAETGVVDCPTTAYLKQMSEFRQINLRSHKEFYYPGLEELVLAEGKNYTPAPLPKGIKPRQQRECFMNSYRLAADDPERFLYVEGYASSIIPVHHAWNVDRETGRVVDTTWASIKSVKEKYPARGYVGIAFPLWVCFAIMEKSGHYGLLDTWELRWPLLQQKLPDFADTKATEIWLKKVLPDG